ncbi:exportin 4 [Heterostelium album PN500]|uniref:Exportin-4 n=1 Tax=Heterostelium pallidum (strain ATCC 26659 / Pp 5 / PN500) TaxID=670386 RepID=D3BF47_HETP5|nr:exportin 4 [Heterostelium album PN500]EFA79761.1 exportin 4 [Heterostelium album PN500]|eukprot:XP_020431882.1 exportin 4 [Heterostelium album PN500]
MEQQQQQINQFIVQLEKYCNDLQSPNGALRDAAEKFIIKFTTMASPYAVCFSLFEQSQSSLVHFYGLTALRDAIIREWATLDAGAKWSITERLMKPPIEWAPSLIENTVVFDLVFELYPLVKTHKDISHVLRNIMICLCCLNGEIMEGSETTKLYMCNIIDRVAPLLASAIQQQQQQQQQLTNTNWSEIEDLSQLVRFFCSNFQFQSFLLIPIEKSRTFFENLTKYIIASMEYLKLTVNSDDIDLEDELENEFFFVLIKAWVGLLADIENVQNKSKKSKHILNNEYFTYLVGIIKVCSEQIYSNYIKTRIELSILELTNDKNQSSNDDNEIDQDKNKYNDQLKVISYLGRINPGISMDLLTKEINKTVDQLINSGDARAFETLHWLILLAGNLLFDSEVVLNGIPNKLETYTYDQSQAGAAKDLVVELSNAVFRYCLDFELKAMLHYKSVEQFSPLIAETCTWFLDGWSLVYLYPTLDLNINISPKLMEAFGPPKQILPQLIGSPHWKEMLSLPAEFLRLNPKIQAKIFSSFTRVVYSAEDPSEKQHRFIQLTQSITNPLDTVFQRADFKNIAQNPEVRETLFTLLHRLNGIVSIPEEVNTYEDEVPLHLAFDLFHKYANAFVSLIPLYIHYPDTVNLILTLFSQFTKFQLETVDEERSKKIFPILVELFNTISNVSQTNTSKVNLENKEQYNRIKMQLRIINNIILFNDVQNNYPKLIVQAVLHGICVTIPCITNNGLLEYTKLSNTFFSIIHFLFSSDTIDLSAFPPNIFNTLLSLIEYGIAHHDTEIANHSLNSILALAKNIQGMLESSIQVDISFTTQLVGSMINFLLLHDFNMDELLYNASNAFIELVILNTDGFKSKVNQLIQHQEAWLHPRLTNSFTQLLNSIEQYKKDKNNENREGYLNNIKKFISTVKPLLKKN